MNGLKFAILLAALAGILPGVTPAQAGDIYTVNAYMGGDSTREKEVILDAGTYIAYVNVDEGDPTKVEIEAELVRDTHRKEVLARQRCPDHRLEVEFTVDHDNTKYAVRVRNTADDQIEIYLKLKEKD